MPTAYHGTSVASALHFLNGGLLNGVSSASLKIDGPDGFFLAAVMEDAMFIAARRGRGTVLEFWFSAVARQ